MLVRPFTRCIQTMPSHQKVGDKFRIKVVHIEIVALLLPFSSAILCISSRLRGLIFFRNFSLLVKISNLFHFLDRFRWLLVRIAEMHVIWL
jgi:hypothetical protein